MPEKFVLKREQFEGPLEALLDMIEGRKLSISEVSMAEVCDSYLAYIEKLPELPLAETSQFILVASTLLLIKSRTLLPTMEMTEDERESVHELERRLARLALVRKAAKLLKKNWGAKPLMLPKSAPARPLVFSPGESRRDTLLAAAKRILSTIPTPASLAEASVAPVLALEDVIKQVHNRLTRAIRAKFSELTKSANRHDTIVYFLAMLELVRSGSASVTQEKLFSDIEIEIENAGVPKYGV
ncbi:segregation/condensation protein A [Candidatus Parcubacteria bacterium]|nr:MAG: segregation/condensation protein A [Candidatus Parcubacteria bacterium]